MIGPKRQFNVRPRRAGKTTMLIEDYLVRIQSEQDLEKNGVLLVCHNEQMVRHIQQMVREWIEKELHGEISEEEEFYSRTHIVSCQALSRSIEQSMGKVFRMEDIGHSRDMKAILMDEYLFWPKECSMLINRFFSNNRDIHYRVETTSDDVYDKQAVMMARFFREHATDFKLNDLSRYLSREMSERIAVLWDTLLTDPTNSLRIEFHDREAAVDPKQFYIQQGGVWRT